MLVRGRIFESDHNQINEHAMVVRRHHVTKSRWKDVYRAEYTVHCGWIDWSHAGPDREDLKTIWGDLPPQNGRTFATTIVRDLETNQVVSYWRVRVPLLYGSSIGHTQTWYVLDDGGKISNHYKRAALTLYEISCAAVEQKQSERTADLIGNSGWSMEDLVSNLMAFYGYIEKLDRKEIISICGGWTDPQEAAKNSKEIYDLLDEDDTVWGDVYPKGHDFGQPSAKSKGFRKAYLYNRKLPNRLTTDGRQGWDSVPMFFQTVLPYKRTWGGYVGAEVLSIFQLRTLEATKRAEVIEIGTKQPSYFGQQQQQRSPSTGRGRGRTPGRLGIA